MKLANRFAKRHWGGLLYGALGEELSPNASARLLGATRSGASRVQGMSSRRRRIAKQLLEKRASGDQAAAREAGG